MGRVSRLTLIGFAVALASVGVWLAFRHYPSPGVPAGEASRGEQPAAEQPPAAAQLPATREAAEARLTPCLGLTLREVVERLGLSDAKRYWTDEPPGILRGSSYRLADGRSVTLYIAQGEPLFRRLSERMEWDYEAFLGCRVGGIQYEAGEVHLDIGPAVPWQWRRP